MSRQLNIHVMATKIPYFRPDTYRIETSVGYLLTRVKGLMSKRSDEKLVQFGITHSQAAILIMLASGKFKTAAELARECVTDAASLKRMLDRLEARQLIERTSSPADKRAIHLSLTEDGKQLAAHIPAIFCDTLNETLGCLSAEEVGFLQSLLQRIVPTGHLI